MRLFSRWFGRKSATSPLPLHPEEDSDGGSLAFAVGAMTDKGRVREHNEDTLFTLSAVLSQGEEMLPTGLYIVADGMGGHEGGEQASLLAVQWVADWILDHIYKTYLLDTGPKESRQPINQVLREAVTVANGKVQEISQDGGTTLTCAFILGTNAYLAHVGDSRAYLISRTTIRQITTDHSLVSRLIELGQLTQQEAKTHPQRNVLYRALGRAGNLTVDTYLQSLPMSSSLLLCSDGLWGLVPERDILSIVNDAPSPQEACRQLVAYANEQGGEDNITAVLIRVQS